MSQQKNWTLTGLRLSTIFHRDKVGGVLRMKQLGVWIFRLWHLFAEFYMKGEMTRKSTSSILILPILELHVSGKIDHLSPAWRPFNFISRPMLNARMCVSERGDSGPRFSGNRFSDLTAVSGAGSYKKNPPEDAVAPPPFLVRGSAHARNRSGGWTRGGVRTEMPQKFFFAKTIIPSS